MDKCTILISVAIIPAPNTFLSGQLSSLGNHPFLLLMALKGLMGFGPNQRSFVSCHIHGCHKEVGLGLLVITFPSPGGSLPGSKATSQGKWNSGEAKMFSEPWIQPRPKSVTRLDFSVFALGWGSITYHLKSPDPYCHATWGQSQPVFIFVSSLLQPPL